MRVAVYAPAKNEARNVEHWVKSARDADEVVMTDTGSTDSTPHVLYSGMRIEHAVITPWRFDDGYNAALAHVSADIDVCIPLALDERLQPGWRDELERAWATGAKRFTYNYIWGTGLSFRQDRIHARAGFRWKYPAHETLVGPGPTAHTSLVIAQPYGESNQRRAGDGPLIHLMLQEHPNDPRALYYSGRQSYYEGDWTRARHVLARYLTLSTFPQERSEACRLISRMVWPEEQEAWLIRAVNECPVRREPWAELLKYYDSISHADKIDWVWGHMSLITTVNEHNAFHIEDWAWDDEALKAKYVL